MSIVPYSKEEDEGDVNTPLETQAARGKRFLGMRSRQTPIDLDEEMEDIEEVGGMTTQPKTSHQLEISLTLVPTL